MPPPRFVRCSSTSELRKVSRASVNAATEGAGEAEGAAALDGSGLGVLPNAAEGEGAGDAPAGVVCAEEKAGVGLIAACFAM